MAYIIPLLLLIAGFAQPKNKVVTYLFLLYFWVLMGLNTYTPDYEEYEKCYYSIWLYPHYELGFQGLCILGNMYGLTFQEFRMIYAALFSLFTYIAIKRLTPYPNYVLALFLLWPFVPGVSGIRQTMANMIVACGIPCLFKDGKKQVVHYILWVLLAASIHQSSLFFLLFIFARRTFGSKEKKVLILLIGAGLLLFAGSQLIGNITGLIDNHKFDKWLNINSDQGVNHPSLYKFVVQVSFLLGYRLLVSSFVNKILKSNSTPSSQKKRLMVYSNISVILLIIIPGFLVTNEYQRLLYATLIVYYCVAADFRYSIQFRFYSGNIKLSLFFFLTFILGCFYIVTNWGNHDVLATFNNNLLF